MSEKDLSEEGNIDKGNKEKLHYTVEVKIIEVPIHESKCRKGCDMRTCMRCG